MNVFKHLPLLQLHEHLANLKPGVSKYAFGKKEWAAEISWKKLDL
jgi:hypothetical protein